ncbi:PREDICTED: 2-acylglycerol O-acyltransferase 3 [Elephantulus edwardii]|uniref:2-acylglycerol O-acyltransferase 3 n=1 Tax=Elephantulus edwardii TaxID=28737 RepID=UPI0003F0DC56|nr:PREDICTED: 2-acylglycerol O-acyltransferase 3 [Elephantulus edwardii]
MAPSNNLISTLRSRVPGATTTSVSTPTGAWSSFPLEDFCPETCIFPLTASLTSHTCLHDALFYPPPGLPRPHLMRRKLSHTGFELLAVRPLGPGTPPAKRSCWNGGFCGPSAFTNPKDSEEVVVRGLGRLLPSMFSSILLIYLLFTCLWPLSVLYFIWLYTDWDTPTRGGRRSEWFRNIGIWKHLRDYFPIKLVKTAELPPDRNYILGSHPHGIMCFGSYCNFATESTGISQCFPGLRISMLVLAGLFRMAFYREYIMFLGICPVSRSSIDFILNQQKKGQAVLITVGGAQECLYVKPGEHKLTLKNRKGFVRLALSHGASLVPVYSFGENDVFHCKTFATDSWQYLAQVAFKKLLNFSPCIFSGRGFFSPNSWGLLPYAVPITSVVGRPIHVPQCCSPTVEQVDYYHMLYMKALEELFEEHKENYGVPASSHLIFS